MISERKIREIIVKRGKHGGNISLDLGDYRGFISLALIAATAVLALTGNDAWHEFVLMTGMSIAWWFRRITR